MYIILVLKSNVTSKEYSIKATLASVGCDTIIYVILSFLLAQFPNINNVANLALPENKRKKTKHKILLGIIIIYVTVSNI